MLVLFSLCFVLQCALQLEEKDQQLSNVIFDLRADITSLWTRLEVPASEQETFLNTCVGPKPSIIVTVSTMCTIPVCLAASSSPAVSPHKCDSIEVTYDVHGVAIPTYCSWRLN